jgi:hypothetical protein
VHVSHGHLDRSFPAPSLIYGGRPSWKTLVLGLEDARFELEPPAWPHTLILEDASLPADHTVRNTNKGLILNIKRSGGNFRLVTDIEKASKTFISITISQHGFSFDKIPVHPPVASPPP